MTAPLVLAASFAAVLSWILSEGPLGHRFADHPNERSLHDTPKSRAGGLAVFTGILVAVLWTWRTQALPPTSVASLIAALALVIVGVVDDARTLTPLPKFTAQVVITVAFLVVTSVHAPLSGWGAGAMLIGGPVLLWSANLFNFMDGMDGHAASMTICGFTSLSTAAWRAGHPEIAGFAALPAAAAAGFMIFNWPPSRIFLGDCGSAPLGFLAAAVGLWGYNSGAWGFAVPWIAFGPFVADATLTLGLRIVRRERWWRPHRDHAYQQLVLRGWSHAKVLSVEVPYFILCAVIANLVLGHGAIVAAVGLGVAIAGHLVLVRLSHRRTA